MKFQQLLPCLLANREAPSFMPMSPSGALVIDKAMIERVETEDSFGHRLQGYKGPVLWTTEAMLYMVEMERQRMR